MQESEIYWVVFSFLCDGESNLFFFTHGQSLTILTLTSLTHVAVKIVTAFFFLEFHNLDWTLTKITCFHNVLPPYHLLLLLFS